MRNIAKTKALGIYVHWPFCLNKCPYCDFNSHVRKNVKHEDWLSGYLYELRLFAQETSGRLVNSVFFGGGTPSLMKPSNLEKILLEIQHLWSCSKSLEVTIEANPSSSDVQLFKDFKLAGVNRLSVGVQSFKDESLKFLGRQHNVKDAKTAIKAGEKIFDRFSFDLIYALPGQTITMWKNELDEALRFARSHLSLYQLTIEPGTEFYRKKFQGAEENIAEELYQITQEATDRAGIPAYEISNHAINGEESVHNLIYWTGLDYIGVGPGAHSRITNNFKTQAIRNFNHPEKWLGRVSKNMVGQEERLTLSTAERTNEIILMGLRLTEGLCCERFKLITGKNLTDLLDAKKLGAMIRGGFLIFSNGVLKPTSAGRLRLNAVLSYLL